VGAIAAEGKGRTEAHDPCACNFEIACFCLQNSVSFLRVEAEAIFNDGGYRQKISGRLDVI
jgi:hypothetical protein